MHFQVQKCSGSCNQPTHQCFGSSSVNKEIEVLLVKSIAGTTATENVCGSITVQEDTACVCGCPLRPESCSSNQYFEGTSCRCLCNNQEERNLCIARGMRWDHDKCTCVCPDSAWKICSTGYLFDYAATCDCVPANSTAGSGLLVALLVTLTCVSIGVIGMFLMYKKQIGLFKSRRYQTDHLKCTDRDRFDTNMH